MGECVCAYAVIFSNTVEIEIEYTDDCILLIACRSYMSEMLNEKSRVLVNCNGSVCIVLACLYAKHVCHNRMEL